MKAILYVVAGLVLIAGAIFLGGYLLPARTTITRSITLKEKPATVFAALADVLHLAEWNRNTERIEMLPPTAGQETTKQTFKGGMTMTIITSISQPPTHLVRDLGDESGPFKGSWNYDLTPTDEGGTHVQLTEIAVMKNPFYRLMTRLFGQTKYIDEHLEDLGKKFGETVKVN